MPFSNSPTEQERCRRYIELRSRIIKIKNGQNLPEKDGRVQILNNIAWAVVSIISRLNIILALNAGQVSHTTVKQLIGLGKGDLKIPLETDLTVVRFGVLTLFQFQLETLLKNILEKITNNPPPNTYYAVTENLLNELSLNAKTKKHRTLNVLATMRNCLHSNGIHTKKTKQITVDGHKMKFIKGKTYKGGNLDEIHFLINEVLTILEEILNHPSVRGLNMPVPSQFLPRIT